MSSIALVLLLAGAAYVSNAMFAPRFNRFEDSEKAATAQPIYAALRSIMDDRWEAWNGRNGPYDRGRVISELVCPNFSKDELTTMRTSPNEVRYGTYPNGGNVSKRPYSHWSLTGEERVFQGREHLTVVWYDDTGECFATYGLSN